MSVGLVAFCDDLDADAQANQSIYDGLSRPPEPKTLFLDPDEGAVPDDTALACLVGRGVPIDAIAMPIAIRAARVCINRNRRYTPNVMGDLAFIIPVTDAGGVVDFCAWVPHTGKTATRLGTGAMLGGELVGRDTGDGVTVPPLRVFRSPLDWLRVRRCGVVILEPTRAAFALAGVVIEAVDDGHADELRRRLRVPAPIVWRRRTAGAAA